MQSSPPGGPACCGCGCEKPPPTGGAPVDGKALGAEGVPLTGGNADPPPPLTGGNGEALAGAAAPLGKGAGNAPWA